MISIIYGRSVMKRVFLYTTALLLLSMGLQAQDQSRPSPYADVLAGISPSLGNEGINVHLSIGIGMQFSNWAGLLLDSPS